MNKANQPAYFAPRRRRTFICPYLRVDGQPVPPSQWMAFWGTMSKSAEGRVNVRKLDERTFVCAARNVQKDSGWVSDVCTSSWGKDCTDCHSEPRGNVISLSFQGGPVPNFARSKA